MMRLQSYHLLIALVALAMFDVACYKRTLSESVSVVLSSTDVELGKLAPNQLANETVKITNNSNTVIHLKDIKTSCSCTTAMLDTKQIEPKQSALLNVQILAGIMPGGFSERVGILTDSLTNPTCIVSFHGVVDVAYDVLPRRVDFGFLQRKNLPSVQHVRLTPVGNHILADDMRVFSSNENVVASFVDGGSKSFRDVMLTLNSSVPNGPVQGDAVITYENNVITIPLEGKVIGSLSAEPESIFFIVTTSASNQTVSVRLTEDGGPLEHFKVTILPENLAKMISCQVSTGKFELRLVGSTTIGQKQGFVVVSDYGDHAERLNIPLYVTKID